jgi:hypothetical protein
MIPAGTKFIAINTDDRFNRVWTIEEINAFSNSWARYDDTEYTSVSPYAFSISPFVIPNNSFNIINHSINSSVEYYDGTKIKCEFENDVYVITVAFKAKMSTANGYMDLYLEGGNGTPYDRVRNTIVFPKGNNVEHAYSTTFQYYADDDVILNGLTLKGLASHSGEIYEVIYFIQRTQRFG